MICTKWQILWWVFPKRGQSFLEFINLQNYKIVAIKPKHIAMHHTRPHAKSRISGPCVKINIIFAGKWFPIIKIRRSRGSVIVIMRTPCLWKWSLYWHTARSDLSDMIAGRLTLSIAHWLFVGSLCTKLSHISLIFFSYLLFKIIFFNKAMQIYPWGFLVSCTQM